jgi:hypothetical protein
MPVKCRNCTRNCNLRMFLCLLSSHCDAIGAMGRQSTKEESQETCQNYSFSFAAFGKKSKNGT